MMKEYWLGWISFLAGLEDTDNPYKHGSVCYEAWLDGWEDAYCSYYFDEVS